MLLEVQSDGAIPSGKPSFWYYYVKALVGSTGLVEVAIGFQLLLSALVFSRILGWCWQHGLKKTFFFLLIFICLAPHMINFIGALYTDGTFAVAASGLLFELWLVAQTRRLSPVSLLVCAILLPFAVFFRPNGLVFLAPVLYVAALLNGSDRAKLLGVSLTWCVLAFAGVKLHDTRSHGAVYPLALFETVNFLQPRPMNLWQGWKRVSDPTVEVLTRHQTLANILQHYDRDYWDPLIYAPDGPHLDDLNEADKNTVVTEFFRYNLWQNLPAFLGSRVNIFMVSALAQGGLVSTDYAPYVLSQVKTNSRFRPFHLTALESALTSLYAFSERKRLLLWTPFLGIVLLFKLGHRGWRERSKPMLLVAIPMTIQLLAIFAFSIAGEYRYLLPFFTLPLVALPALAIAAAHQP